MASHISKSNNPRLLQQVYLHLIESLYQWTRRARKPRRRKVEDFICTQPPPESTHTYSTIEIREWPT